MTVHLSIDDAGDSLRWLTNKRPNSIFNLRLFSTLKQWHEQFGAKFTLYIYAVADSFSIDNIPVEYANDFKSCFHWMKFGYHGSYGIPFMEDTGYEKGFNLVDRTLDIIEAGRTDILRLHNWQATTEQKEFLHRKGISCLLYPDDDNFPYDKNDSFYDCGLLHRRTRVRFENLDDITPCTLAVGRTHIDAFTHEWCFDSEVKKIQSSLEIYSANGYEFIA